MSGAPGEVVTYTLTVTNTGNMTDTFSFTAAGETWTTGLPADVTIDAGESMDVEVTVAIPAAAADGDSDSVTITATSDGDNNETASSELTTTAVFYYIYLPVVMKP
ncbi:MAG: hypothetical protein M5U34_21465 [Chloroflexi bacterium]|nr:hypothetical protein [Chloroflexota bacterium]